MQRSAYGMSVRVNGRALKEFPHNGDIWIEGRKGSEFTIRLNNDSGRRILAVVSIDGLSVMNGEDASKESGGYVLEPYQNTDIPGWRLDNDDVARFKFHKAARSYAAKTDRPANVGIIGCAIFEEKIREQRTSGGIIRRSMRGRSRGAGGQSAGRSQLDSFNGALDIGEEVCKGAPAAESWSGQEESHSMGFAPSLGTEFGRKDSHRVRTTTFEKASNDPAYTFKVRYADRKELQKRGVDMDPRPVSANKPDPFPADQGCKPPEDWRG